MPINDISTAQNKVFGINFLTGEVREAAYAEWNKRFSSNTAAWIDSDFNKPPREIFDSLRKRMTDLGVSHLNKEPIILVFLLDLTNELDTAQIEKLWQLQPFVDKSLGTKTSMFLQFGYVGELYSSSAAAQRKNVSSIINVNSGTVGIQYRLCLVAKPILGDVALRWKAATVFLDILRRKANPNDCMPITADGIANNDVGIIRYEEFDQARVDELNRKSEKLKQRLGDGGLREFQTKLDAIKDDFVKMADSHFDIDGSFQPQHPNMLVSGGINVLRARKGNHNQYNEAKSETEHAVIASGRRLEADIEKMYTPFIQEADKKLSELFETASVGMKLKKDRNNMHSLLKKPDLHCQLPILNLSYDEKGAEDRIHDYLAAIKKRAVFNSYDLFLQALKKAYDEISDAKLQEEEKKLSSELNAIEKDLQYTVKTVEEFCIQAANKNPVICDFNVVHGNGTNMKLLLVQSSDPNRDIGKNAGGTIYSINPENGDIPVVDAAMVKAVQIVLLDCTDNVLQQLLPEGLL